MYEHKMHGRESLRYLWVQRREEEVYETVGLMCRLNGVPEVPKEEVITLMRDEEAEVGKGKAA